MKSWEYRGKYEKSMRSHAMSKRSGNSMHKVWEEHAEYKMR